MKRWRTRAFGAVVACAVAAGVGIAAAPAAPAASGSQSVGKFDTGALTPVAKQNPMCDPSTGRFKFQYYAAPPCVKEWKAGTDNGGATAQGVTKDKIKVVVLWATLPADQIAMAGVYTNQATGKNEPDGAKASLIDENEVFKHVYQTWGRTVEYEFVKSTGAGETEQRADALAVKQLKPFGVIDLASSIGTPGVGGGRIFEQTVLDEGIPYVTPMPRSIVFDTRTYGQLIAEFMKKQLVGGKAQYADASLASKERKFGILHSSAFDNKYFQSELKRLHLPAPVDAEYSIPPTQADVRADASQVQEALPTLITKLKDAGVTTLIMQTNHSVAAAASKVMAQQEWFPEVVVSSQPYEDLDLFARTFDQKVWSHAFGMVWFPPYLTGHADETAQAFQWFWGTDKGTRWPIAFYNLLGMYSAIQFVGPKLTAKSVTGDALGKLFSEGNLAAGGWYSKSAFTVEIRVVAPGEINPRGVAMGWYDPNATAPGNYNLGGTAKGSYVYLNDGQRFVAGHLPTQKQKFFDSSVSHASYDTAPPSEPKWPTYQCVGCPSTGSTDFVPASAAS